MSVPVYETNCADATGLRCDLDGQLESLLLVSCLVVERPEVVLGHIRRITRIEGAMVK